MTINELRRSGAVPEDVIAVIEQYVAAGWRLEAVPAENVMPHLGAVK